MKTIKNITMKEMMKAIIANAYGGSEVLQLKKVERPQPGANEILVKVFASTVTTADSMMLSGKPYFGRLFTGIRKPKHAIPGTGFAGEVVSIGTGVKKFRNGMNAFGVTTLGMSANAEFVSVPESGVILPMPESMNFADAATFGDGPVTSLNFLNEVAQMKAGQKVVINGASGSLGTAAVQLAKYLGAEVTAVCSTRNLGLIKSLGADQVIDYTKKDFTQLNETFDVVFDTIGKSSYSKCKNILSENGQYLSPVMQLSTLMQMLWTSVFGKKKAKFAATGLRSDAELASLFDELQKIYSDGHLKVVIDRQFPLEKVAEAYTYVASGHKKGNVIIVVQP